MFASVYFAGYSRNRSRFNRSGKNPSTEVLQLSIVVQVATAAPSVPINIFKGALQGILGFNITLVRILVDNGYDIQQSFLC